MSKSLKGNGNPGIVVLAAGGSVRMQAPKQLQSIGGVSLVRRAAQTALASGCHPVVVVLGANADLVCAELEGLPLHLATNTDWRNGLGSSIACGIRGLLAHSPSIECVLLMLADQPYLDETSLQKLIEARRESGSDLVAAWYSDQYGTPALFSKVYFDKLLGLRGAAGAKGILQDNEQFAVFVELPEAAFDLDTPDDLAAANRAVQ